MSRIPVVIESPFAGCVPLNRAYLEGCIRDALERGETPYASHKMLTDALNDLIPEEREKGIKAGLDLRDVLIGTGAKVAFYGDLGLSDGMARSFESVERLSAEVRGISEALWGFVWERACDDPRFQHLVMLHNAGRSTPPLDGSAVDWFHAREILIEAGKLYVRAYS